MTVYSDFDFLRDVGNNTLLIFRASLVFLMQAGFAMLCAGTLTGDPGKLLTGGAVTFVAAIILGPRR